MKLYKEILAFVADRSARQQADPGFEAFLTELQEAGAIKSRKKWSDLGH